MQYDDMNCRRDEDINIVLQLHIQRDVPLDEDSSIQSSRQSSDILLTSQFQRIHLIQQKADDLRRLPKTGETGIDSSYLFSLHPTASVCARVSSTRYVFRKYMDSPQFSGLLEDPRHFQVGRILGQQLC